ncbi:MAG: tRNA (adenosine(37)-N6)-threonylcarbamoyltransferase complex ATPase subunit type 1 TsaE [Clostridia bacterium]|nr:tRNA (adenosine(37)-N6)-threonylcarbamoyltransferase complex ATPase subunit type 1 TsaE [Clostridia bacterium]
MNKRFICKSLYDTQKLADEFANSLKGKELIAMFGDLGAGKTTFTKALCKALSIDDQTVTSPTFSLMNEYYGKYKVYHYDMYRIDNYEDLEAIGFFDYVDSDSIKIIEWSENIIDFINPDITVNIRYEENENERIVDIDRKI